MTMLFLTSQTLRVVHASEAPEDAKRLNDDWCLAPVSRGDATVFAVRPMSSVQYHEMDAFSGQPGNAFSIEVCRRGLVAVNGSPIEDPGAELSYAASVSLANLITDLTVGPLVLRRRVDPAKSEQTAESSPVNESAGESALTP